jgi:MinD-like ATPase involved in chromosome partitioning or flagellar assembly
VERDQLFATSRLLIVAGKGGAGKTTGTAVLARAAAATGKSVLVVAVDADSPLGPLLGLDGPITVAEVDCGRGVSARLVTPGQALDEYLEHHGMGRVAGRLAKSGVIDLVAAAAPGIDDILVLGKVKHDLVLLDAPAAGHALSFLRAAQGLSAMVRVGPIATQAADVRELLADHDACQVVLVALAEETPVNETIEAAFALEDDLGIRLGPVVVNACYDTIEDLKVPARASAAVREATTFRLTRVDEQNAQRARLAAALPLDQLVLPFVFAAELTPGHVEMLAARLLEQLA